MVLRVYYGCAEESKYSILYADFCCFLVFIVGVGVCSVILILKNKVHRIAGDKTRVMLLSPNMHQLTLQRVQLWISADLMKAFSVLCWSDESFLCGYILINLVKMQSRSRVPRSVCWPYPNHFFQRSSNRSSWTTSSEY